MRWHGRWCSERVMAPPRRKAIRAHRRVHDADAQDGTWKYKGTRRHLDEPIRSVPMTAPRSPPPGRRCKRCHGAQARQQVGAHHARKSASADFLRVAPLPPRKQERGAVDPPCAPRRAGGVGARGAPTRRRALAARRRTKGMVQEAAVQNGTIVRLSGTFWMRQWDSASGAFPDEAIREPS